MEDHRRNMARMLPHQSNRIRRNLFSAQVNRRDNNSATGSMPKESLAEESTDTDNTEIAVRNADGGYQFSIPSPPAAENTRTPEQEADYKLSEMLANRSRQSTESGRSCRSWSSLSVELIIARTFKGTACRSTT